MSRFCFFLFNLFVIGFADLACSGNSGSPSTSDPNGGNANGSGGSSDTRPGTSAAPSNGGGSAGASGATTGETNANRGGATNTDPIAALGGALDTANASNRGGDAPAVGGNASSTGGRSGAGGAAATSTNSTSVAAGGKVASGGAPAGGRSSTVAAAGGIGNSGTATIAVGGKAAGGSATGGAAASAGAANPGTCVPASCGSHKWACWKMPNPTGSGLPNPASYSSTTDVVHDNVTCLDWQRSPPSTTYSNADAIAYCDGLSLGGFDDWRAPTRIEMMSILDWTRSPATDAAFSSASGFHKTGSNWVLVIDQKGAGAGSDSAWAFNLSDGITSNNQSAAKTDRVRCVRGNGTGESFSDKAVAPPNQYTNISADEVEDNYTGLIWQRAGDASGLLAWEDAVTYCQNLTLGGATWRLPSVRELSTLVDEAQVAPAINRTAFSNTKYGSKSNNWYWAAHRQRGSTTAAWGLNFDDGFTGFNAGASGSWNYWTQAYAKCVR